MIDSILLLTAAMITVMMGMPIITRLARAPLVSGSAPATPRPEKDFFHTTHLEPLDFGPVTTKWPSQMPQRNADRPELAWPSLSWEEDLFGSRESLHRSEAARVAADTKAEAVRQAAITGAPNIAVTKSSMAPTIPRQAPASATSPKPRRRSKGPRSPAPLAPPVQPTPQTLPATTRTSVPDAAMVEAMLAEKGLAGTVRALMDQTGWDLDTVASFIAERR